MAIDFAKETVIAIRKVPEWCQANIGRRVHPSTVNRWHRRGSRSVRLETLLIGGSRVTSAEALSRFFCAVTAAADGQAAPAKLGGSGPTSAVLEAEAYLDDQA